MRALMVVDRAFGVGGRAAVGVALLVGFSACSSPAATAPAATFTEIYPLIFPLATKAQCSFCHGLPPNEISNGKLSTGADKAAAYAALVGPLSVSTKCTGKAYVVPGQPENSVFYRNMTDTPLCSNRMPLGGDPLTAAQLEMVRSWIAAGAKND